MSNSLVAIVTGGAQGLGAAICETLLKKCYKVCVTDINEVKGIEFVKQQQKVYGEQCVKFIAGNVSKEDDFKDIFDFAVKEYARIDVLVNNAGIVSEHDPKKCLDVNLMGPLYGCKLALQYMGKTNGGKGGAVINISSVAGLYLLESAPTYAASKYGVLGLTRSYGIPYHLDRDGVMFAALCPTAVKTEMYCSKDAMKDHLPVPWIPVPALEGLMEPLYVAEGVLKLLEDKINGSVMLVMKERGFLYVGYPEELYSLNIASKSTKC